MATRDFMEQDGGSEAFGFGTYGSGWADTASSGGTHHVCSVMENGLPQPANVFGIALAAGITAACLNLTPSVGSINAIAWESGIWTVNLDINTANANINWNGIHIVRLDNTGTVVATIASTVGFSQNMGVAGPVSQGLPGISDSHNQDDVFAVVLRFTNLNGSKGQTMSFQADIALQSPLVQHPGGGNPSGTRVILVL